MTHAVYVYSGYAITAGMVGAYAAWIISRNRKLRREDGLRDPNAVPGLRDPNAVPALRDPNVVEGAPQP